jgi:hypothetical protein
VAGRRCGRDRWPDQREGRGEQHSPLAHVASMAERETSREPEGPRLAFRAPVRAAQCCGARNTYISWPSTSPPRRAPG